LTRASMPTSVLPRRAFHFARAMAQHAAQKCSYRRDDIRWFTEGLDRISNAGAGLSGKCGSFSD
jgi:hypothetical protein